MAEQKYGFIKDGNVINVAVFDNPTEELLNIFIAEFNLDAIILGNDKTQVGGTYDGENFWRLKPYQSWIKNEEINEWVAPVDYPLDGNKYIWDETIQDWKKIDE
jgi:hypothetical protein